MAANMEKLTPLDLLMPRLHISALLTFRTSSTSNEILPKLQSALDAVVQREPWLAYDIFPTVIESPGQKPGLEIRAVPNKRVVEVADRGTISSGYTLLANKGLPSKTTPDEVWPVPAMISEDQFTNSVPVLAASVFRFSDGQGIGLCVCMHHNVVDATGLSEVVRLWARSMEPNAAFPLPVLPKTRVQRLQETLSKELQVICDENVDILFALHPEFSKTPPMMPFSFPENTSKMFTLSIDRLKKIRDEISKQKNHVSTTNTIVSALIWSAVTRARQHSAETSSHAVSKLVMAANGRRRICNQADFSTDQDPYFGNVIGYSWSEIPTTLSNSSLANISQISDIITASNGPSKLNSSFFAEIFGIADKVDDYRTIFPGRDLFNSRDLTITSWADTGLYGVEFGALGRPDFVRIRYSEADGVVVILPRGRKMGDDGDGVLDLVVMLRKEHMGILEGDEIWMKLCL